MTLAGRRMSRTGALPTLAGHPSNCSLHTPIYPRTELNSILLEIKQAYDNVGKWSHTEKAPWHYMWFAMSPATRIEPKGVVLLITPFNFPLYLILAPFVSSAPSFNRRVQLITDMVALGRSYRGWKRLCFEALGGRPGMCYRTGGAIP